MSGMDANCRTQAQRWGRLLLRSPAYRRVLVVGLFLLLLLLTPYLCGESGVRVTGKDFHAISAYFEPRLGLVRIIAAAKVRPLPLLFCAWMTTNKRPSVSSRPASVSPLTPKAVNYDGLFIDCPLPRSTRTPPHSVAVTTSASESGLRNFLRITTVPYSPPRSTSLAACVCPLHGSGSWVSPRHLVSWIEMNRLLGVERFVFYNHSAPASLQSLFHYYSRLGVVELVQWRLSPIPVSEKSIWPPPQKSLHYFGQYLAFNECLYRLLHRYHFAMFADLDELLVPTAPGFSLPAFLQHWDNWYRAGFAFRGSYVRQDFPEERDHRGVLMLRFGRREQRVLDWNVAPKLIVKPHFVRRMGIHEILRHNRFYTRVLTLPPEEALLMHYRNPPPYLVLKDDRGVRDERVVRYHDELLARVERVLKKVGQWRNGTGNHPGL